MSQHTFALHQMSEIIACLQTHVYISPDDILQYDTKLKEWKEKKSEKDAAIKAKAEPSAEALRSNVENDKITQ